MDDLVIETGSESKKFALLPENYYTVYVNKVTVKDQPKFKNPSEMEKVIEFEFTVLDDIEFDDPEAGTQNTRGRRLWKTVRPKINPPFSNGSASWLYQITCGVYKKDFNEEECQMLATNPRKLIESLLNKQLRASIAHYTNQKGDKREKITNFTKALKELEPYTPPTKEGQEDQYQPPTEHKEAIDDGDISF